MAENFGITRKGSTEDGKKYSTFNSSRDRLFSSIFSRVGAIGKDRSSSLMNEFTFEEIERVLENVALFLDLNALPETIKIRRGRIKNG